MNNTSPTTTSPNLQIRPSNPTLDPSHPSFPTTHPDFLSFKFKSIGQPPTLLSRLADVSTASGYHSPSPDIDMVSPDDPPMIVSDGHHTLQPTPRKSLLDMLSGVADQGHIPKAITTQKKQVSGVSDPIITSPLSTSPPKPVFARTESRTGPIARQLPSATDVPRADPASTRTSAPPEIHTHDPPDSDMVDLYADPDSPSRSPLSLFSDLSEAVRESADLDRITTLHRALTTERQELLRRHEETTRALSRTKSQLDHVLSLTDEAFQMTAVFVNKEKARLETKKTKAEAEIEHRKNLEAEQRRKAKELERVRQHEEERKARIELEEQAERQRLEEQRRKEEALAAERERLKEIQANEHAQAEERRRLEEGRNRIEEEERRRRAEEDQKRDEDERKRQAEERKEEEERLRRKLAEEKEAVVRKQEEERRTQLLERRRLVEDERKRKEAEAAAAKSEAEKQAAEKEQQRIFLERRATVLKDKYKNYNRPELGPPFTGSSSTHEGTRNSNLPAILVNDLPKNPQVVEHHPGLVKVNRVHDTPTFVPATTEAGRLLPDLSRRVVSDTDAVKHETTSPVIIPVDNAEPAEGTPLTPLPSRHVPSMSMATTAPAPAALPAVPHLPARPATIYSQPPLLRGRYPVRRSPSESRSPSRSPRRGSPISRLPSRPSRSPDPLRRRYSPPSTMRGMNYDHYSPPHQGSRYNSLSISPPPHNMRKRAFQDHWDRADTPSKLDYSHPTKRRAASPLRSRSPPSPPTRTLTHPPHVTSARRPPTTSRRGRGGALPLEQRLSSRPHASLSERIN